MKPLLLAVAVLASSVAFAAPRKPAKSADIELSVGRTVYPTTPSLTSATVSWRWAEVEGIDVFADAGWALANGRGKYSGEDGLVVGLSAGKCRQRFRYGLQWQPDSGKLAGVMRVRVLGW